VCFDPIIEIVLAPEITRLKLLLVESARELANELTIINLIADNLADGEDHDALIAVAERAMTILRTMLRER